MFGFERPLIERLHDASIARQTAGNPTAEALAMSALAARGASPARAIQPEPPQPRSLDAAWELIQKALTAQRGDEMPELLNELTQTKARIQDFLARCEDREISELQRQHEEAYRACRQCEDKVRDAALEYSRAHGMVNTAAEYVIQAQKEANAAIERARITSDYPTAEEIAEYERAVEEAQKPVAEAAERQASAQRHLEECERICRQLQREFAAAQEKEENLRRQLNGEPVPQFGFLPAGSR